MRVMPSITPRSECFSCILVRRSDEGFKLVVYDEIVAFFSGDYETARPKDDSTDFWIRKSASLVFGSKNDYKMLIIVDEADAN